jgi:hypothetical protein
MKKLKDLCLSVLIKEGEEIFSLSPSEVGSVTDVNIIGDDIKISFNTSYGKTMDLLVKKDAFKNWVEENNVKNVFRNFIVDFLAKSSETSEEGLNEIIDDDGNIMPDQDMPSNSTNSMVVSPKFDLEKIYKSFVPKSIRFYSGDLGIGYITW